MICWQRLRKNHLDTHDNSNASKTESKKFENKILEVSQDVRVVLHVSIMLVSLTSVFIKYLELYAYCVVTFFPI